MRAVVRLSLILISILWCNSQLLPGNLVENDPCELREGVFGICKKNGDCLDGFRKIKENREKVKICEFFGNKPVICCPQNDDVSLNETTIPSKDYAENYFNIETCRNRYLSLRKVVKRPRMSESRLMTDKNFDNSLSRFGVDDDDEENVKIKLDNRMYLGSVAEEFEWQFIAAIGWNRTNGIRYSCAGVIVSEEFVITAARCRNQKEPPHFVRVGDRYLNSTEDDEHAQEVKVKKFIQHPYYNSREIYHDIALIQTEEKINFNQYILPACIGNIGNENIELKIAGYGHTELLRSKSSNELLEITVNVYANCSEKYTENFRAPNGIISSQICTMSKPNEDGNYPSTCHGDAGAPVKYTIHHADNRSTVFEIPIVVAVVSYGTACGLHLPNIHTRITDYRQWILDVMNNPDSEIIPPSTTTTSSSTTTTPVPFVAANINTTDAYDKNYFHIKKCYNRHLINRKYKKRMVDVIEAVKNRNMQLSEDDCDYIHDSRDEEGVDCVNGVLDEDSFYHMIRGTRVKEFDWKAIAAIGWTNADDERVEYNCGGVIISERFILTAAHCRVHNKVEPRIVRVGDRFLKTSQDDNHAQQLGIEKFFYHPNYSIEKSYNDIAIIKTGSEIKFNNYVVPSCISNVRDNLMNLKIAGYGINEARVKSNVLEEISVTTVATDNCSYIYEDNSLFPDKIIESQICLIGENATDSCQGDSGGPVQYIYEHVVEDADYEQSKMKTVYDIPMVVGVVSLGIECGLNFPSVNTRISPYINWIICVMNELMSSTSDNGLNEYDYCEYSEGVDGMCRKIENCSREFEKYNKNQAVLKICDHKKNLICCNKSNEFPNDYLSIEKCRDRHLILRTSKKNAKDLIGMINEPSIDTIEEYDPFYHMLQNVPRETCTWSFIAAIGWTQNDKIVRYLCSGVIISDQFIVTAAHCRSFNRNSPDTVRVGDRYLQTREDDLQAQQLRIERFIYHHEYKGTSAYNDIAMIKTKGKIQFNNYVVPTCIGDISENSSFMKLGSFGEVTESMKNILHEIFVDVLPSANCSEVYEHNMMVPNGIQPSQICLMSKKDPSGKYLGTCSGDSGSPSKYKYEYTLNDANYAQTKLKTVYDIPIVVSLISFGMQCGHNYPSISTRLSYYNDWMLYVMNSYA